MPNRSVLPATESTTESSAESTTESSTETTTETAKPQEIDLQKELDKWKAESRKHESRAKANSAAAKELETLKASMMSDQDKAINEAVIKAKADWSKEVGSKLALAEFKAQSAGRFDEARLNTLVSGLNLSTFVTDDGEPDVKSIGDFLDGIAPKTNTLDLGQGARGNATPLNDDSLTRGVMDALGIKG